MRSSLHFLVTVIFGGIGVGRALPTGQTDGSGTYSARSFPYINQGEPPVQVEHEFPNASNTNYGEYGLVNNEHAQGIENDHGGQGEQQTIPPSYRFNGEDVVAPSAPPMPEGNNLHNEQAVPTAPPMPEEYLVHHDYTTPIPLPMPENHTVKPDHTVPSAPPMPEVSNLHSDQTVPTAPPMEGTTLEANIPHDGNVPLNGPTSYGSYNHSEQGAKQPLSDPNNMGLTHEVTSGVDDNVGNNQDMGETQGVTGITSAGSTDSMETVGSTVEPTIVPEEYPKVDGAGSNPQAPSAMPENPLSAENDETQWPTFNTIQDPLAETTPEKDHINANGEGGEQPEQPNDSGSNPDADKVGETQGDDGKGQQKPSAPGSTENPDAAATPPPYGFVYDEKDVQPNANETKLDLGDVLGSEGNNISNLTMGVDQEWLDKEKTADMIQKQMPAGTGFSYKRGMGLVTPIKEQPKVRGGVLQTLIDKEAEIRRRFDRALQIEHDLKLRVNHETATIVTLLTQGSLEQLRNKHPLVFSRLMEPLRVSLSISQLGKTANQITSTYDKHWYIRASPAEKQKLLQNIRKDAGRPDLFASKVKKPKEMSVQKSKVYEMLERFFNDFQCQKIIRGNQIAKQTLRMFDQQSGLYVAPFYTEVVPSLGSQWMIAKFERFYKQTKHLTSKALAKGLPQMVGRFMLMVENGTLLPTSPDLQVALYSLSAVLSRIMDGKVQPKIFLGKAKYYGFMGMCDNKCYKGIMTNHPGGNPSKTFFLNKQQEILKWISLYLRDDLLKIDTMVQKILLELMFRTTNDLKYTLSDNNLDLQIKTEYVQEQPKALLELPAVAAEVRRVSGETGRMTKRFISGYRKYGMRVNNKGEYKGIAPYNAFKSPKKLVAALDDGLLAMIEVVTDVVNLRISGEVNSLYMHSFNTWVQLQTFHNAIHSYETISTKTRNSSKTLGAIFRFLNSNMMVDLQSIPKQFLPFTSLVLQMAFYLQNTVEGYQRSKVGAVKNLIKGLSTFSLKGKMGPKNFDQLYSYFQPHIIYNRAKYRIGRSVVSSLVNKFKSMFLAKPAIPTPIIQLITVFIGQWAKGSHQLLDLANSEIDRVRKNFFLSFVSNHKGMAGVATEIIMQNCKAPIKMLQLGCLSKYGLTNTICKQVSVTLSKSSVLKVMEMLDATFDDPLDIVRVASDTARRCMARTSLKKGRRQTYENTDLPTASDRLMIFSEITHRYHCYTAQKTMVTKLTKAILNNGNKFPFEELVSNTFSSMRTISVKQADMKGVEQTLVCPFMDDAPEEMRNMHRRRIIEYVKSKLTLRKKLAHVVRTFLNGAEDGSSNGVRKALKAEPLQNLVGCILVGTRKYDGIVFYGGYVPPQKVVIPQGITLNPGDGRLVYNGTAFISELEALNRTASVKAITMEKNKGVTRRIYHMENGKRMDELEFGLNSNDFIVKAHVLTTASGISAMGYSIGKFIWCGYEHGWVVDFALHDVIGNADVPVFNGTYWLLSKLMLVKDMVGDKVNIKNGELLKDKNIREINVDVYSGDGRQLANYPSKVGDASAFIKGSEATFTFDTGYGSVSPGAIQDLIRNAEFDLASNTLVINLDAPGVVLQNSPLVSKD